MLYIIGVEVSDAHLRKFVDDLVTTFAVVRSLVVFKYSLHAMTPVKEIQFAFVTVRVEIRSNTQLNANSL